MSPDSAQTPDSSGGYGDLSGLESIINELRNLFEVGFRMRDGLEGIKRALQNPDYQEVVNLHTKQLIDWDELIKEKLKRLLSFPPCHSRHFSKLGIFHSVATFRDSVFIMTKFPEGESDADAELTKVINTVSQAIKISGFYPRIASGSDYHDILWDNVELYLLGCSRGIAIVEDKYKPELNPNVAMEWGWMRGMGKNVLYLVEDGFKRRRADWSGLLEHRFAWDNPEGGVLPAVSKWLTGKAIRRRTRHGKPRRTL
jgi:hypothetical protein